MDTGTPQRIEDYAMIGDRRSAALVGRNGSIDWLCLPRFDSPACFAALLGAPENGRWQLAPEEAPHGVTRAYRDGTMILETLFETATGSVAVIDFMVPGAEDTTLVRIVEGRGGRVRMRSEIALRFDYGISVPWVTRLESRHGICAIAGPNMVVVHGSVPMRGEDMRTVGEWSVGHGQQLSFVLTYRLSHLPPPAAVDARQALADTEAYWRGFIARSRASGPYKDQINRSILTLKALTYGATGGISAAVTTSLPEQIGGQRNWDYRFCWLRDASLTLFALMNAGFTEEASQWRDWLQRSVAGDAAQIQIMYGLHGERWLDERELPWLAGYEASAPVRVGNAASAQLQLDIYGEVIACLHQARLNGLRPPPHGWSLHRKVLEHLTKIWEEPDQGMWEIRGPARHFTYSKIMAWVAVDRTIKDASRHHLSGPVDEWRALRQRIFDRVMAEGFDRARNSFTQSFGSQEMDATLLLIPKTGFLPANDPRYVGTVKAVEEDLLRDGFLLRYRTDSKVDGLSGDEGAFLACSFWLVEAYASVGRAEEARALFERLLGCANDVGLLSEEYDPRARRQLGNTPQAFSHVALISAAMTLSRRGA